ncbi:glycoside hydrolase family 95 protein [Neotamlana sedimentorum]|uniref:glycoside hydrolase family 95 protein n=1 Tax=Neotamlana sedimentorum TaxID=1435349 RepID=UPI0009E404CE|nr:glycoside hydrolase family 95 protein [Tamlana sedimentorum]
MNKLYSCLFFITVLLLSFKTQSQESLQLNYNKPAGIWTEALPVGNGRLGAMVYGNPLKEHLQLNENTLYSGEPTSTYKGVDIKPTYKKVKQLINDGKYAEAEKIMTKNWLGRLHQSYQPFGDLRLQFQADTILNYKRSLDIKNALLTVNYETSKAVFKREILASYLDDVIAIRITSNKKEAISFTAFLESVHPVEINTVSGDLVMKGQAPGFVLRRTLENVERNGDQYKYPEIFNEDGSRKPFAKQILYGDEVDGKGMFFEGRLKVKTINGKVSVSKKGITITNANEVVLLLSLATSFNGFDKSPSKEGKNPAKINEAIVSKLKNKSFEAIKTAHQNDYQSLFNRVQFNLKNKKGEHIKTLYTNQRLKQYHTNTDVDLNALLFQYGRYLMISGSRKGGQPLNLQGIWNYQRIPSWNSAYTMNINAQMNYWPAEVTNLPECHEPFFRLVKELAITGKETAKNMYGKLGWVVHHNTDIWRPSYPTDNAVMYSYWPVGAGWLTDHLWEHYLFTQDQDFLKHEAYLVLKGAAQFFVDWLVKNKDGYWVTPVGTSPENSFKYNTNKTTVISEGPTMDMAIIKECFNNVIQASKILNLDADFRKIIEDIYANLLPYKIGSRGKLQEWQQDYNEVDVNHRHLSHLYGFHPGNQITDKDKDLFNAVNKTLNLRGDLATGWSMGWKINFWARMQDGNHAYKIINNLFTFVSENDKHGGLYANLFDAHPPFQIDGNFGYTAGVAEMLLQSQNNEIHLLPALPDAWESGNINGIKARGNVTVEIIWENNKLVKASLISKNTQNVIIRYNDSRIKLSLKANKTFYLNEAFFNLN